MGVLLAEHLQNFLSVAVILGKDDGLAQLLSVVNFQAVGHQQIQSQADGILVEQPLVEGRGLDPLGQLPILIGEGGLILRLFLLGQIGVGDALLHEFQLALHREEVHQKAVLHRLGQFVAVGRHTALQFKDLVSVLVDLILWGGCETHQGCVKVVENIPILIVDGAVGLVADDQIEVAYSEQLSLSVLNRVDAVHHGLVGRKDAVGRVIVLLLAQVGHGEIGQQIHKAALGLGDQRVSVGQEEDIFHPTVLEEYIHQSDDRAGLARAGGHDQQGLPAVLGQSLTGGLDGPLLVVAAGNVVVHLDVLEACPHGPKVEELLQVPLGVEGGHPPLRVGSVVDPGVKAVGEEDHRAAAIFLLQQVGVQLGLLAALGWVHTGALGLDDGQGAVGVIIEHIVGIAHLALVGHTGQLHLVQPVLPFRPARVGEHGVNV